MLSLLVSGEDDVEVPDDAGEEKSAVAAKVGGAPHLHSQPAARPPLPERVATAEMGIGLVPLVLQATVVLLGWVAAVWME